MAAANSPVAAIFRNAASPGSSRGALVEGPLTVERADDRAAPEFFAGRSADGLFAGRLRCRGRVCFFLAIYQCLG
jgi:hypothetical protein